MPGAVVLPPELPVQHGRWTWKEPPQQGMEELANKSTDYGVRLSGFEASTSSQ